VSPPRSRVGDAPVAPTDPRHAWGLPPLGGLPPVAELDEAVVRVVAPNPSPMTLDGTNTYLVGARGTGEVAIVDPGPVDPSHLARVTDAVAQRDAEVRTIVVTHHHRDHAAAAAGWSRAFGCRIAAVHPAIAGPHGLRLADGVRLPLAGLPLEVVATPGHTADHVAVRLPSGALLTGDHILGRGTSVIAQPDGDLVAYLAGLARVLALGPDVLYPGHGPELRQDPAAVVAYYLEHRRFRQEQLLHHLARGPAGEDALVAAIYADVDRALWPAAGASTSAALTALEAIGRIRRRADGLVERLEP
jgi:glyoxylase-like metal-dependent hydrolase (beta-lactamase superfamily II)